MYSFVSPEGQRKRFKTVKEFSQQTGIGYSEARTLACGMVSTAHGWLSCHPRAKKKKSRFMTSLYNIYTGQQEVLGSAVTQFAKRHNLNLSEVSKLINGKQIYYRGWVLRKSYDNAINYVAARNF